MIVPYVKRIIICATGFGVNEGDESDIFNRYYWWADHKYGNEPNTHVYYRTEDAPWKHIARRLNKIATPDCIVIFIGHSWACGGGYYKFEREWAKLGRRVNLVVLIDPVTKKFPYFIRAMLTYRAFPVVNADEVFAVRQLNKKPIGRRVVLKGLPNSTIRQITYGSEKALARYKVAHGRDTRIDEAVDHNTIDGLYNVIRSVRPRVDDAMERAV